jgi:hypothetical protein
MFLARRQLFPQSLEDRELKRIECPGFQAKFLGFKKLDPGFVPLPFGVIRPRQMEGKACVARISGLGTAESLDSLIESAGPN